MKQAVLIALFAFLACTNAESSAQSQEPSVGKHTNNWDNELKDIKDAYEERNFEKVVSILDKRAYNHIDDPDVLLMLGQSYYAEQKIDLALKAFNDYLEKKARIEGSAENLPREIDDDTYIIANLYAKHGHINRAEELFKPFLQGLTPMSKAYRVSQGRLARIYSSNKYLDKAEALLKSMLKNAEAQFGLLHPDSVSIRRQLAAILIRAKKKSEAESLYNQVLEQCENLNNEDDVSNCLSHLADYYVLAEEPVLAEAPLVRALSIRRKLKSNEKLLGQNLENLQIVYEKAGAREKILTLFEDILKSNVETPEMWKKRAVIFARAGYLDKAAKELQKLQSHLSPSSPLSELTNVQYCLGQLYLLNEKLPEALSLFERVEKSLSTGSIVTSIEYMPKTADFEPSSYDIWGIYRDLDTHPHTCHFLGAFYCRLNQFEKASNLYEAEIPKKRKTDKSDLLSYLNALAWTRLKECKYESSVSSLEEAIKLASEHPEQGLCEGIILRANLAKAKDEMGNSKGAETLVIDTLSKLNWNYHIVFCDPVPGLGDMEESYFSQDYLGPGAFKKADGSMRVEPAVGYSNPPLVLFKNGKLGVQDYSLYPNEPPRKGFIDWNQPPQMTFLQWAFRLWEGHGDHLKPLGEVRLADIYSKANNAEAEVQYDKAIKDASIEACGKDVLSIVLKHKAEYLKKQNRLKDAEQLENQAAELMKGG